MLGTHGGRNSAPLTTSAQSARLGGLFFALNQANKLTRSFSMLLDTLNRHRGKGQQKVTVEHVHVHSGGQAIVGNVEGRAAGDSTNQKESLHASRLATHLSLRCG